ncbi:hypothetical protein GGI21_006751, partial [Coemansia aciculifera]
MPAHQQQQQAYEYRQDTVGRSEELRSPSAQVQQAHGRQKYAEERSQYDYGSERMGSRDAEASSYRSQARAEVHDADHGYNLDAHLSRQQGRSHAFKYGASEPSAYAHAHYQQRSPVPPPSTYASAYPDETETRDRSRYGITSLLANSPVVAHHEAEYESHHHRHRYYDDVAGNGGGYPESHAVMSISQLVAGEGGGAYHEEPADNGYAYDRWRGSHHDVAGDPSQPIVVPSDDDEEAARHGRSAAGVGSDNDDGRQAAVASSRSNRAIRPRPGAAEDKPSTSATVAAAAAPKRQRTATGTATGV